MPPVFAHKHADVSDAYYQSVGVVSHTVERGADTTVYRMMFSGARHPQPPGFRIVDYRVTRSAAGAVAVEPTEPMRLCPEIVKDMATPFISKDGRYVVAHDDSKPGTPASLKLFEIRGRIPPAARPPARSGSTSALPPARPTSATTDRSSRSTSASTTT